MRKTVFLTLAFILVAVSPAAAALNEYYTYGGFSPVTIAFDNIALIFADNSYKGIIASFAVLGLFFGCAGGFIKMAMGQGGPLGWLLPFLIGVTLYLSLFVPTTTLAVYDPVYGSNKVIAGLPVGVAYLAGLVNHIERYIVDTFDTNAPLSPTTACGQLAPMQYAEFGGAVGMRLMQNTTSQYVQDSEASQTMMHYVDDCVTFEINRPGSTLTMNKVMNPGCGKTVMDVIADANNPANFTTSNFGSPSGNTKTCEAVYTELSSFYGNAANSSKPLSNACGGTGFADLGRCQQLFSDMYLGSTGETIDPSKFISNITVANLSAQSLVSGNGAQTAQFQTLMNQAQNGSSGGFMAGVMNPYMIDAYVAYSFMLMPILVLFLVTPLWKNAFGLIISLICWTALLRSLDVITFHLWVTQYQQAAAAALANAGMGVDASMRLPLLSNQYLGNFASMRNSVFLLATAVSGALFKFGDSAMSRLADKATAEHSGTKAALADPNAANSAAKSGVAGAYSAAMMSAVGNGAHGWDNMGRGMAGNEFGSAASGAGMMKAYGGGTESMMQGQNKTGAVNTARESTKSGNTTDSQARGVGRNDAASQNAVLEKMGTDGKMAGYMAGVATDKNIGDTKGFVAAYDEAKKSGYTGGSIQDFQKDISQLASQNNNKDVNAFNKTVADKFGGNRGAAIQSMVDSSAIEMAKKSSQADQLMAATGQGPVATGVALGKPAANSELMGMASDNVRRAVADQNASPEMKQDPAMWQNGSLTEAGYLAQMGNIAGSNQQSFTSASNGYGQVTKSQVMDKDGNKIMSQEKGSVGGKKEMHALADELRKQKGFENTAKEIDKMADAKGGPKGFDFQMSRDKGDRITGFDAKGGGTATLNDKVAEDRTNRTASGTSSKRDDTDVTLSGKSSKRDDTDVTLSGKSSKRDDTDVTLSGKSSKRDDTDVTLSGKSSKRDDTDVTLSGKSSKRDDTDVTLSGKSSKRDDTTFSQSGDRDVLFAGRTEINAGTVVDGAANTAIGAIGESVGLDRKNVEMTVGTVQNLYKDIVPIAQTASAARTSIGKETAAKSKVTPASRGTYLNAKPGGDTSNGGKGPLPNGGNRR